MGTCVHFSRSLPSNSWWQTMVGWQALSRPSAAEGGGRRPVFTGLATQPYSATEVDGWQHKLSRVSQNQAAVQPYRTSQFAARSIPVCRPDQGLAACRTEVYGVIANDGFVGAKVHRTLDRIQSALFRSLATLRLPVLGCF